MAFELPTNYSLGTVANSTGKLFMDYPSAIISEWGSGLILLIWMSVFAISSYMGSNKALTTASFTTAIFAIYFSVRDWINPVITIALIVMTIIGVIGSKGEGGY